MIVINIVFTIVITILVFGVLIFIHELGHFLMAKANGIKVNEFALGMGPTLLKKQGKETVYAIRAFPIGGFVSMEGEDSESPDERAFNHKPVWRRILVTIAGVVMNLLLGLVLLSIINACFSGDALASTTVAVIEEGAMPGQTGLQVGDKITSINGTAVFVDYDIQFNLLRDNDGVVDIGVERDGQKMVLNGVTFDTEVGENGVRQIAGFGFKVQPIEKNVWTVVEHSALQTLSVARLVWLTLVDIVTGNVGMEQLSGPVGTATVISEAAHMGVESFLMLVAFITINLGVFNLLPIPGLDGGRLLFLIIEGIRRKPIPIKYEGIVNLVGLALMMLLLVAVTFNDIVRIVQGG